MACNCHGKLGTIQNGHVPPTSQCTACARKHLSVAFNLFTEISYQEDNRVFIIGQLRLAMWHLMTDHRQTALKIRDLAIIIQQNKDKEIKNEWNQLITQLANLFYKDHPDALERLQELKNEHKN